MCAKSRDDVKKDQEINRRGGGGGVLFEPDGGGFPDPDDYVKKKFQMKGDDERFYRKDWKRIFR